MTKQTTTPLDEIRAQAAAEIIEIPGFRPGKTIRVAVRPVDLTPHLLTAGVGNPLLAAAQGAGKAGKGDLGPEAAAEVSVERLAPVLDAVARAALAEPSYEDLTEIAPLTLQQRVAIFEHVTQGLEGLTSFRGE